MLVVGRGIAEGRQRLAEAWAAWIATRHPSAVVGVEELAGPLRIILDILPHMTGPLRREARETWFAATELYGRLAEARGLSAGEVVDELQHLRELLIVELGDLIVALPARQQLPAVLRLNRVMDAAVSNAVVGYTDALVAKMFSKDGVPVPTADSVHDLLAQIQGLEAEIRLLEERAPAHA